MRTACLTAIRIPISRGGRLLTQEHRFPAVILWPHHEMQSVAAALVAFDEQLIIVLPGLVGIVHQNHRITESLLEGSIRSGFSRYIAPCFLKIR